MSETMKKALQSVVDLHTLIENVFTGRDDDKSLAPLLASFDDNFKMVTIQGQSIGLDKVNTLFSSNIGNKTSFSTRCLNMLPLREDNQYCWVQYQEKQLNDGVETLRTSTACIRVEAEKCYWVYLHETPVA
ncbi:MULTISPECIES: hypothetical protein [Providencia]|uniref:hypothetical protein n=1 Tax=Providencia TaxID=586 RepID=UPI0008FBA059|nr:MULTISPECIES: hypothetical protein [Providencia]APC13279.1 hypothetical protein RB151_036300 [Providencia rettgeri]AVL72655.1 hypothetical protein CEQ08_02440 [Providencia rettgeri]EKH6497049.1 hypothetical protein [Providencia rettgeri]ELR5050774.1 hypothetical protein [Providencia rettgeri]ELR5154729.1 hypothetical protein [Providencia rettgeri]